MHILLLILKIIGIILLVLLGILLTLILLLLFVPFCYRAEGSFYDNKPQAMARIRYLFPLLQVLIQYKDDALEGKVKLFGLTVYDLFGEKEEPAPKTKRKLKKKKNHAEETSADEPAEKERNDALHETAPDRCSSDEADSKEESLEDEQEEKLSLAQKIKIFIKTIKDKIISFIQKIKDIHRKGIEIKEKISFYYEVWQKEYTQRAFSKAKASLYKVWKSVRPRKGIVKFHFGTGDPGSTGQMCGYFGMLYPFIGKYVMIEPDFENKIYEGDFYFKGHLTIFVFLKVAWIILFDKDIKKLRKILMNSDKEE